MKQTAYATMLAAGLLLAHSISYADSYTTVALPSTGLNTDLRTWSDGTAYNPAYPTTNPGSVTDTFMGIPFLLETDALGNNAFFGAGWVSDSLTIPINITGASTVYTLINTANTSAATGGVVGSLIFNFSNSSSYQVDLIEGNNVRDHYYDGFVNTTSASNVTEAVFGINAPGNAHLDMQAWNLPSEFSGDTLVSLTFNSTGGPIGENPFITGVTVSSVPLPSTIMLMSSSLALLGGLFKRRNK